MTTIMQGFTVSVCNTIWRFAAVNMMCLALMVAGGVVLGLGPAIAASLWAMSRQREYSAGELCQGMWNEWRSEFVRTNLALTPLVAVLALLVLFIPQAHGLFLAFLITLAGLVTQGVLAVLYVASQVRCGISDTLGNAIRVLLGAPLRLFAAMLIIPTGMLVTVWQPLFGVYGLFSVAAWLCIALLGAMHDPASRILTLESNPQEALS